MARPRRLLAALAAGFILAAPIAGLVLAAPSAAWAMVSEEAASKQISERYGVQVLKVRAGEIDGRKVWLITVMEPGGNRNNAFQVHLLAVDQQSGDLVPSFRHYTEGYSLPPPAPGESRP